MATEASGWSLVTSDTLVAALRDGNEDAWKRFTRLYIGGMSRWLERRGLQPHDRDDVLQRVLLSVFSNLEGFRRDPARGDPQLRPWLMTILANTRNQLLRERQRSPGSGSNDLRIELLHELEKSLGNGTDSHMQTGDAAASYQHDVLAIAMAEARAKFPQRFESFWRKYSRNDLTFREIGEELGIGEKTARQAHYEILKWLKQRLSGHTTRPSSDD